MDSVFIPKRFLARPYERDPQKGLRFFEKYVYGVIPTELPDMKPSVEEEGSLVDPKTGEIKGNRKQVWLNLSREGKSIRPLLLIQTPPGKGPFAAVVNLNMFGNDTVTNYRGALPQITWSYHIPRLQINPHAGRRGSKRNRFDMDEIVKRGYAAVTVYYGDLDPDFHDGFKNGVHALYPEFQERGDNFASLGAWSWGFSRIMDYLETEPLIDAKLVALYGFSRIGKAALHAMVHDTRFAAVMADSSGKGGAAPFKRKVGEALTWMRGVFPHWFAKNFAGVAETPERIPTDQHELIAAIDKPILISVGNKDTWSDPEGQHLMVQKANGLRCLRGQEPRAEFSTYPGGHAPGPWAQRLDFLDRNL